MVTSKKAGASLVSAAVALSFAFVGVASALTASCVGTPSATNVTWAAASSAGIEPIAFLWGNGSTSSAQVIAVGPGTYTMTLQATDASSTVATTTCSATVVAPPTLPSISSFVAAPTTITAGQSSILSWVVANASTTSIDNSVGLVAASSVVVNPTITTTYTLSAVNPAGTTTASATVTVNPVTPVPPVATSTNSQIQALLAQIAALKAQILQLVLAQHSSGNGIGTSTPATTTPVSCFDFGRDFGRGHRGDDVRELQKMLASDPSILPPGLVTGFFGQKTEEALKRFQRKFGIGNSGFFGPLSRKYFKEQCTDTDHDGVLNMNDNDDDNDGIVDTSDPHPLIPESKFASTTRDWGNDNARDKREGGGSKGRGGKHDD